MNSETYAVVLLLTQKHTNSETYAVELRNIRTHSCTLTHVLLWYEVVYVVVYAVVSRYRCPYLLGDLGLAECPRLCVNLFPQTWQARIDPKQLSSASKKYVFLDP